MIVSHFIYLYLFICLFCYYIRRCPLTFSSTAGILQREQEQSVVYGSIDSGKNISSHAKFLELVSYRVSSFKDIIIIIVFLID